MQLRLPWHAAPPSAEPAGRSVTIDGRRFPIVIARHHRARRYVIRVTTAGEVRLTVPARASIRAGVAFAARQSAWILREWHRRERQLALVEGGTVWYRGEEVPVTRSDDVWRVGDLTVRAVSEPIDLKAAVEARLRRAAERELPGRLLTWAGGIGCAVRQVSVRNQRSRWGACSSRGVITLNWRLIQAPERVADYVMLHELAHLAHPNHSRRFWRHVAAICPWWREAEHWLKTTGRDLL
jgi:predicted metal-dependent hydrolase